MVRLVTRRHAGLVMFSFCRHLGLAWMLLLVVYVAAALPLLAVAGVALAG